MERNSLLLLVPALSQSLFSFVRCHLVALAFFAARHAVSFLLVVMLVGWALRRMFLKEMLCFFAKL
jgi:hypothetical protein